MTPLTDDQKEQKAKNIIKKIELQGDLKTIGETMDALFADVPIQVANATSKEEIEKLINSIKQGTSDNNKVARFLEIASSLGL